MIDLMGILVLTLLQASLLVVLAPGFDWAVDAVARRAAGRRPMPMGQAWRDLARMLRKQSVMADTASVLHRLRPWVECGTALGLLLMVPAITTSTLFVPTGDLLVFAAFWMLGQGLALMSWFETDVAAVRSGAILTESGWRLLVERLRRLALRWGTMLALVMAVALLAGTSSPADLVARGAGPVSWPTTWLLGATIAGDWAGWAAAGLVTVACLALIPMAGRTTAPAPDPAGRTFAGADPAETADYSGRHAALVAAASMARRLVAILLLFALLMPGSVHSTGDGLVGLAVAAFLMLLKLVVAALVLGLLRHIPIRARRERFWTGASFCCAAASAAVVAALGGIP